jgi:hypothetical protein
MPNVGIREWWAVGRAMAGGRLLRFESKYRFTDQFERRLAAMIGAKYVLTVNGEPAS